MSPDYFIIPIFALPLPIMYLIILSETTDWTV